MFDCVLNPSAAESRRHASRKRVRAAAENNAAVVAEIYEPPMPNFVRRFAAAKTFCQADIKMVDFIIKSMIPKSFL